MITLKPFLDLFKEYSEDKLYIHLEDIHGNIIYYGTASYVDLSQYHNYIIDHVENNMWEEILTIVLKGENL